MDRLAFFENIRNGLTHAFDFPVHRQPLSPHLSSFARQFAFDILGDLSFLLFDIAGERFTFTRTTSAESSAPLRSATMTNSFSITFLPLNDSGKSIGGTW